MAPSQARKRSRDEEEVVEDQQPAKKQCKEKGERETSVKDKQKRKRSDSSGSEEVEIQKEKPSKKKSRYFETEKAVATVDPSQAKLSPQPIQAPVPPLWRAHYDYIKGSTATSLRRLESELRRRLNEQEKSNHFIHCDTRIPEHNKEVTSHLLQTVQSQLKIRSLYFKGLNLAPRRTNELWKVPFSLRNLYEKYNQKELTTFTCFGRLPPELRLQIWEKVEDARIVRIEVIRSADGRIGNIISRSEPPAVFLVCKESRLAAAKVFDILSQPTSFRLSIPVPIPIDYKNDTIYFHRSCFRDPQLFTQKDAPRSTNDQTIVKLDRLPVDLKKIRSLAFDAYLPKQIEAPALGNDINNCSNLEKLTLIFGETYKAHLIPKGEHCPIVRSYSALTRVARKPLHYGVKRLNERTYISWLIDGNLVGANNIRGVFREICSKEKNREEGAINCLEIFHRDFHKFKRQWEDGPKKRPYPALCKCHKAEHEQIMREGISTWSLPTSDKKTLDITAEEVVAALPAGGWKNIELLDHFGLRNYSPEAQIEFQNLISSTLFIGEDNKLRPKKNGPLDVTPEQFVAVIPVGGILRSNLYRPHHVPPTRASQHSKLYRRHLWIPALPHFSTYSPAAQAEFLKMVDELMYLGADKKLKLRKNAPLDITQRDILNFIPNHGSTHDEIYEKFGMKPDGCSYSDKAREEFAKMLKRTVAIRNGARLFNGRLFPKRDLIPDVIAKGFWDTFRTPKFPDNIQGLSPPGVVEEEMSVEKTTGEGSEASSGQDAIAGNASADSHTRIGDSVNGIGDEMDVDARVNGTAASLQQNAIVTSAETDNDTNEDLQDLTNQHAEELNLDGSGVDTTMADRSDEDWYADLFGDN